VLEVGDRIDVWVVTERLGHGGMGSVYRCHNVDAPRIEAAIKVLGSTAKASEEGRKRFVREAEILYRVKHPSVVAVRNIRLGADPPFIEMEFVDGRALHEVIDEGPQSEAEVLGWMTQLALALEHLHEAGIRHRDIKPANLLLDDRGVLKLVDFGLALETDEDRLTREGMTFGTVSYAPPEWMDPPTLDPVQWDLYALGVVFYELLTGRFAFPLSGEGPMRKQLLQVALAKQSSPPLDPGPSVSDGTRAIVRRLTAHRAEDRPQSASDLLGLLDAASRGEHVDLPPLPQATPPPAQRAEAPGWPEPEPMEEPLARTVPVRTGPPPAPPKPWARIGAIVAVLLAVVSVVVFVALRPEPTAPPTPEVRIAERQVRLLAPVAAARGLQVEVGDDLRAVPEEGLVSRLAVGEHAVTWWLGPCDLDACPGEACSPACGTGTVQLVVPEGEGEVQLAMEPEVPLSRVTVHVPSLEGGGGLFKKRPELSGWVGQRRMGKVNDTTLTLSEVWPGELQATVVIGECPRSAHGCHPKGCPKGCRSEIVPVVVPWGDETVRVTSRLSLPD
jgi:predicted Ser/Thr protein kinase